MSHPLRLLSASLAALALACGCSAGANSRRVDRAVEAVLPERTEAILGTREATVRRPEERTAEDSARAAARPGDESPPVEEAETEPESMRLGLSDALAIAVEGNRDYETRLEGLVLSTMDLLGQRHAFSPQLAALVDYTYSYSESGREANSQALSVGASQIMPWGGSVSVDASTSSSDSAFGPRTHDPFVAIRLSQPLLRGGGREVSQEPLVQAERNLTYAIRDFELFREDFSIDVARRFYSLVQSQRAIDNQRKNLEEFIFARRQAEALFNVGRANELNVLRARRQELNSQNDLIAAEESYHLERDRFRIFLGLPQEATIEIVDEAPEFVQVEYDRDSAVEVALANRLDVISRREQLEDAERGVRLSRNGLLPDLDLDLSYDVGGDPVAPAGSFGSQSLRDEGYSASVRLGLPIDRVDERLGYRATQIAYTRAQRSFEEFLDNLVVEVRSALRELDRRRESVEIQTEQIQAEEKNVRIAEIQFEQGGVDNRDVVDAQQSLLDARNALINEQVNYEIARLQLLRDLGILFIDEQGMWKE